MSRDRGGRRPGRLAGQGTRTTTSRAAIRQATSVDAVGRVAEKYKQYLIVTDQEAHGPEDIANVVVTPTSGSGCASGTLHGVAMGTEDHTRVVAGDGEPAALLNITRQIGGNTVAIADSVAGVMRALAHTLPPGVRLGGVRSGALVRDAVASVRDAMLIGAAFAVMVLLRLPAAWRDHGDQRHVDPADAGDHRVRDVLGRSDVQPHDARGDGDRHRAGHRRRGGRHGEHRAAPGARPGSPAAIREAVQELIWPVTHVDGHDRGGISSPRICSRESWDSSSSRCRSH